MKQDPAGRKADLARLDAMLKDDISGQTEMRHAMQIHRLRNHLGSHHERMKKSGL